MAAPAVASGQPIPPTHHPAPSRTFARPTPREILSFFGCAVALACLPFTLKYWPSQDGPNHLALVHILRQLQLPGGAPFAPYFDVDLSVRPYMGQYYLLLGLAEFMPLLTAEKVVVSATILGWIFAAAVVIERVAPQRWPNLFVALPLAAGFSVMMGFTNFNLALPLSMAALALSFRREDEAARARLAWVAPASLLLLLATFAHPISIAIVLPALVVLEPRHLTKSEFWLRFVLVAAPALVLLVSHSAVPVPEEPLCGPGWTRWIICPVSTRSLHFRGVLPALNMLVMSQATLSFWELFFRGGALLLLGAGLFRLPRVPFWAMTPDASFRRLLIAFVAAFVVGPDAVAPLGAYMSDRALAAALVVLPAVAGSLFSRRATLLIGAGLTLGVVTSMHIAGAAISRKIDAVVAAGERVPEGQPLLPFNFDLSLGAVSVQPGRHAWGHIVMQKNVFVPYLFAGTTAHRMAGHGYRPLIFKSEDLLPKIAETAPADALFRPKAAVNLLGAAATRYPYVLAIGTPDVVREAAGAKGWYDSIYDNKSAQLLVSPPRSAPPVIQPSSLSETRASDVDAAATEQHANVVQRASPH